MTLKKSTLNLILIFWILTTFSSCSGQTNSESIKASEKTTPPGKVVSELDDKIWVIFQDKQNHYWFAGGNKGVYKYDGENLILFTKKDGLCDHAVVGIQEDKFGNIYFDTYEGVSKFDGQKFATLDVVDNSTGENEWKLAPDDLWFSMGTNKNGPYRYDGQSLYQLNFPKPHQADEFYKKYPFSSYSPYGIYTMYKDSRGSLWFGTASLGFCRYNGTSIDWLYEDHLTNAPNGGDFGFRSIIEDKDGYFWFCNTRYRFDILPENSERDGTKYIDYKREDGMVQSAEENETDIPYFLSVAKDNDGLLWMVTYDNGVWRHDGEKLIHYPIKEGDANALLFSIYKDNEGTLFLGTHNAGVYRYNGTSFEKFVP